MESEQGCACRTGRAPRRVFTIAPGNDVLECSGCGLQYARRYPEIDRADAEIYSCEYFRPELEKAERRERVFLSLLEELESHTRGRGRLLDIGAGDGALARAAVGRGWQVEVTDISSAMVHYLREAIRVPAHHGVLEDLVLEEGGFDAVVLNHVLEHVKSPFTTLETVRRLLRPGGVVRVEVPNLGSLSSRWKNFQSRYHLKRSPWKHYSTGHHFWFFTPRTLVHVLESSGLEIVRTRAPVRQWGEMRLWVRLANPLFDRFRLGGHLVAYGRRPVAS